MKSIARVKPKVLVINGGDGTVQAALTELYHGGHFGGTPPPVAVLPNGKTNLIAHDLGANGDVIAALERVLELARTDMMPHIVSRELISLSDGDPAGRPVLGMFLGGAGLADTILYCRHKIYPLGLPNWAAHGLALILGLTAILIGRQARFLPMPPRPDDRVGDPQRRAAGQLRLPDGDDAAAPPVQRQHARRRPGRGIDAAAADRPEHPGAAGRPHRLDPRPARPGPLDGVHLERGDEIRIEGSRSSLLMDGELFEADTGRPIVLRPTPPVPFLKLAA